jgi:hypothetical protein
MSWQRLRRLKVAWGITFGGFVLASVLLYQFGIPTIEKIQDRFGLSDDWLGLFVVPLLLPSAVITVMIRRFKCPECGGRFVPLFGGMFARKCGSCGTPRISA